MSFQLLRQTLLAENQSPEKGQQILQLSAENEDAVIELPFNADILDDSQLLSMQIVKQVHSHRVSSCALLQIEMRH